MNILMAIAQNETERLSVCVLLPRNDSSYFEGITSRKTQSKLLTKERLTMLCVGLGPEVTPRSGCEFMHSSNIVSVVIW